MATSKTSTRIGEAERTAAQRALHEHLNAGRLQVDEYADRSAAAANAMTASEIRDLFADLPAPRPKLPGSPFGGARLPLLIVGAVVVLALGGLLVFAGSRPANGPAPSGGAAPVPTPIAAPPVVPVVPSAASSAVPSASVDESAAPLPDGITVRRTTGSQPITLRPAYGVDLDDATSPNWSVSRSCCGSDVAWASDGNSLRLTGDYAVVTGSPEYATCAQETGYTNGAIERGSLQADEQICVRTGGNRYALVTIVDSSDQAVQLRAVVWDPPIVS